MASNREKAEKHYSDSKGAWRNKEKKRDVESKRKKKDIFKKKGKHTYRNKSSGKMNDDGTKTVKLKELRTRE
jgi:hypothetical protein